MRRHSVGSGDRHRTGGAGRATDGDPGPAGPTTFIGTTAWNDVDPATIPGDVPFLQHDLDRVLRSQATDDGTRWRVDVSYAGGPDSYANARAALLAAGYRLAWEESGDPQKPTWNHGEFIRDYLRVVLDVSNETGEGFFGQYYISRIN